MKDYIIPAIVSLSLLPSISSADTVNSCDGFNSTVMPLQQRLIDNMDKGEFNLVPSYDGFNEDNQVSLEEILQCFPQDPKFEEANLNSGYGIHLFGMYEGRSCPNNLLDFDFYRPEDSSQEYRMSLIGLVIDGFSICYGIVYGIGSRT